MNTKELYIFILEKIKNYIPDKELKNTINIILEDIFNCNTVDIIKNNEIKLDITSIEKVINDIVEKLKNYEPIQYIVGQCKFLNCKILLNKNVLIPRQETEEMVYNLLKTDLNNKQIIDICSGSGCIGISIKKKYINANVTCIDIDKKTIALAKKNSILNNVKINFINEDIFNEKILSIRNFDILISNPPYIPESYKNSLEKKIVLHEPHIALFVKNENPLMFYERLKLIIENKMNTNGLFFIEIPDYFEKEIITLFNRGLLKKIRINKDLNNKSRWISGEKI